MVQRYILNLDLPASERWNIILSDFKDIASCIKEEIEKMTPPKFRMTLPLAYKGADVYFQRRSKWDTEWHDEVVAVSQGLGITTTLATSMQIIYEAAAGCTSLIVPSSTTQLPLHGRTMDWQAPFLKKMTIELDIQKNNKTLCLAVTWAGYLGLFTVVKPNGYSVSVNIRRLVVQHPVVTSFANLSRLFRRHSAVGDAVRKIATDPTIKTYDQAVQAFRLVSLASRTYLTIGGTLKQQGIILSKEGKKCVWIESLSKPTSSLFGPPKHARQERSVLIQTNLDAHLIHKTKSKNPLCSDSALRHRVCQYSLKQKPPSVHVDLLKTLFAPSVCNAKTIYVSLLDPVHGTLTTQIIDDWVVSQRESNIPSSLVKMLLSV